MITKTIDYFDARKIMNSGQIFRMYEPEDGHFVVFSGNKRLELFERRDLSGKNTEIDFCCFPEEFEKYWEDYFDMKRDYGELVKAAEEYYKKSRRLQKSEKTGITGECIEHEVRGNLGDSDAESDIQGAEFLKNACEYGADIRVLKQDIWEMMISFIISQQKQIPSIRKCIEALCERFGEKHVETAYKIKDKHKLENTKKHDGYSNNNFENAEASKEIIWYGFPSAEAIAAAGPDGLKGLSLGYRERYIYETAVKYLKEGIRDEELRKMTAAEAKKYLCSFTGIGDKVADCICLFGAGFTDAFPIDVHIKDILYREFVPEERKTALESTLKNRLKTDDIPRKKLLESMSYQDYMTVIDRNFSCFEGVKGIIQQWIFAYEIIHK